MKSNKLKIVNDRCKINFEKAFAKIAECCGLSSKIRNADAVEEFQDFMLSLERFYLRKMNHKQKQINKFVHKLKEKELPKNTIIIDGTVYEFDHYVTEGCPCDHCDLAKTCPYPYKSPLCSIFEAELGDGCFKKKGDEE